MITIKQAEELVYEANALLNEASTQYWNYIGRGNGIGERGVPSLTTLDQMLVYVEKTANETKHWRTKLDEAKRADAERAGLEFILSDEEKSKRILDLVRSVRPKEERDTPEIVKMKAQIESIFTYMAAQLDKLPDSVRATVEFSRSTHILFEKREKVVKTYLTSLLHRAVMIDKFVVCHLEHRDAINDDPLLFAQKYFPVLSDVPTSWLLVDPENGYTFSTSYSQTLAFYRAKGYRIIAQYTAK